MSDEDLRGIRTAYLAAQKAADVGTSAGFARRDRALEAHRDGEYVLWFEADLYDQLQLTQILAKLRELEVPPSRITLICIGEYPGIAHFGGLGELDSEQLSRLPATAAATLTAPALELATRAWSALRAPDPGGLGEIATTPSPELRFVDEAFDRLSREYPSTRDGLSLTERRILAAVADGAQTAGAAFERLGSREARPFLGDTWCFDRMTRLCKVSSPLLWAEPVAAPIDRHTRLRPTDAGRRVLEEHEDHVTLNGVDRWIGGVHLRPCGSLALERGHRINRRLVKLKRAPRSRRRSREPGWRQGAGVPSGRTTSQSPPNSLTLWQSTRPGESRT